jgi:uncharacterized linocin/CFP29 family protein
MADILKRNLAPIADAAWEEINKQAGITLKGNLSARRVVDFSGPHGWEYGAVDLGRVEIAKQHKTGGVYWGVRALMPLVEVRVPFHLDLMELDSISRGSANPDLEPLQAAAEKIAQFEENAVYNGFPDGGVKGLLKEVGQKPVTLPKSAERYADAVVDAQTQLQAAGVNGPYALVLGTEAYKTLQKGTHQGYPLRKRIEGILDGSVLWSPAVTGGILLTTRGGDFELTVGQDLSVGYCDHDRDKVELYFAETFIFRVLEPAAAVQLKVAVR